MEGQIVYIIVFVVCLIFSAYFSASETAYTSSNEIRLKHDKEEGDASAERALNLLDNFDSLLSTILIGNNFVNVLGSSVATIFFVNMNKTYGATIATLVTTVLVLIFGEITPKLLARTSPESIAKKSGPILSFLMLVLKPLVWLFDLWQMLVVRFAKVDPVEGISESELKSYVDEAHQTGGIESSEARLVQAAIDFDDRDVRQVLIPRVDIIGFDVNTATDDEIESLYDNHPYSRLIVYDDEIDNVVGMIHIRNFHRYLRAKQIHGNTQLNIKSIIQEVIFVPPNVVLADLLSSMQKSKLHMSVVLDEYGGTKGIATMEDIIEVLVGEIWDERDFVEVPIEVIEEGKEYYISGQCGLREVFSKLNIVSEHSWISNTLGGFVVEKLNRVPEIGDVLHFEGYDFEVVEIERSRVSKLHVVKNTEEIEE